MKTQKKKEGVHKDGLPDNVGFPHFKGEGYVQPLDEQLDAMKRNGYLVEHTDKGILITPKC